MSSSPVRTEISGAGNRRQPSRLQRRAPPLKITPAPATASSWNAAIPLLSPLAASPTSSPQQRPTEEKTVEEAAEKTPVFERWQHPAAPFCYEPAPFVPPFVPV